MVTINKNILINSEGGISLNNYKKNTNDLFAELFSIIQSDKSDLDIKPQTKEFMNQKKLANKTNSFNQFNSNLDTTELEAAKYLAETFYKEIGVVDNENFGNVENFKLKIKNSINIQDTVEPEMKKINKNDFIGTVELEKNKIINEEIKPFNFKVKLKLDNNSKKISDTQQKNISNHKNSQKIPENIELIDRSDKNSLDNNQLKNTNKNLIERKSKKKGKQILKEIKNEELEIKHTLSEEKTKSNLNIFNDKVSKKPNANLNLKEKNLPKSDIKSHKSIINNSNEQKILDFMETNWEQKFSQIIKESIKNNSNKLEIDVKPKNLGKVKLEVTVKNDVTNIDFITESLETANLINEHLNRINDYLSNEKETNYLSQGKNGNENFSHQKNNNKNSDDKQLINKKEVENTKNFKNNSNHNIDVNA